jgi:hypothetical protein
MGRSFTAFALVACLALAIGGCGGSGDSTTDTSGGTETSGSATAQQGGGSGSGATKPGADNGSQSGGGSSQTAADNGSGGGGGNARIDPAEFKAPKGGDNSIQTFGEEVEGDEKDAVVSAMRSFLHALAASEYQKVCDGLTSANIKQLELYLKLKKEQGDCPAVLSKILIGGTDEARRAANGAIYQVRIEGENAFVLFTPEGGTASYFVMKNEDGAWKSTTVSTGTPFDPLAASQK